MSRFGSKQIKTVWKVELFPFDTVYPQTRGGASGPVSEINIGVNSIRVSRSKNNAVGNCTFSIIGNAPKDCFPGTWVLVTTSSFDDQKRSRKLVRFIGQIYDMTTDYITLPDSGLTQVRSTFMCREWSSMLEMPVRYDLNSIAQAQAKSNSLTGIANLVQSGGTKKELSNEQYQEIVSKSFSAYELAQLILKLIGAIGENDQINLIKELGDIGLSEVSLRMPSVPQSLLERLGLKGVKANAPFTSGFCDVITGVQKNPTNNKGDWDGVWGRGASPTIESYKKGFDKNPGDRPITLGLSALASMGDSAWNLINKHCDPALNEFFTDILYQQGASADDVVAKPVIFARDKPFLMRRFKDLVPTDLGSWTIYDDLPRVQIDNVYIDTMQLKNTFINSPNFIRMNFSPQTGASQISPALSQLEQTQLAPEMDRFGGQEFFVETQFLSIDVLEGRKKDFDLPTWFSNLRAIASFWHSYNYRMASGSIRLRDDNIPVTVGMNVQFQVGNYKVVGHVESIDVVGAVLENGQYQTTTTLQLSRVVHDLGGRLEFIPPSAMSTIMTAPIGAVADSSDFVNLLSSAFLTAIKGIAKAFKTITDVLEKLV